MRNHERTISKVTTDGPVFSRLASGKDFDHDYSALATCVAETVEQLYTHEPDYRKPGMLLGMVQSGKTKTFLGVIAVAFDNGYDIAVILTKSITPLTQQTIERLDTAFREHHDQDLVRVFDVMKLPPRLTQWELKRKLIVVCKKQKDNLRHLSDALFNDYPTLSDRRILIVDDEADYASIGFHKSRDEQEAEIEMNTIAKRIDQLRKKLVRVDFLQVTATPYSLYLQPDDTEKSTIFEPTRPAFTTMVPVSPSYVGGEYYFEHSRDRESPASKLYREVAPGELDTMKKQDRRSLKLEEVLVSKSIVGLRSAIVSFLTGACIRLLQNKQQGKPPGKYSFIIHTERAKLAHDWQESIVREIVQQMTTGLKSDPQTINDLVRTAYDDLAESVRLAELQIPTFNEVYREVALTLDQEGVWIAVVNSKQDVNRLLDRKGQLCLRAPLSIFVGGQMMDRGVTIENLIGFYYGRRATRYQQDAVLQHSRMYGYRPKSDLAVTRLYTTPEIHTVLCKIHENDTALRNAFAKGANNNGVVFIRKSEDNKIIPCNPNKILRSDTTTLWPFRRLLPIGFQTLARSKVGHLVARVDEELALHCGSTEQPPPFLLPLAAARIVVKMIWDCFEFAPGHSMDMKDFVACMEYLSIDFAGTSPRKGHVHCLVRRNRNASRTIGGGAFYDSPDTPHQEGVIAKAVAHDIPMLMLFGQNGLKEKGWSGGPFWWPVLYAPGNTQTTVFANRIIDSDHADQSEQA